MSGTPTASSSVHLQAVVHSALESTRFGIEYGRLDAAAVRPSALADAVAAADAEGLQVLSVRVDSTELKLLNTLEDLGFRLMDTLVYYRRDPSNSFPGIK